MLYELRSRQSFDAYRMSTYADHGDVHVRDSLSGDIVIRIDERLERLRLMEGLRAKDWLVGWLAGWLASYTFVPEGLELKSPSVVHADCQVESSHRRRKSTFQSSRLSARSSRENFSQEASRPIGRSPSRADRQAKALLLYPEK